MSTDLIDGDIRIHSGFVQLNNWPLYYLHVILDICWKHVTYDRILFYNVTYYYLVTLCPGHAKRRFAGMGRRCSLTSLFWPCRLQLLFGVLLGVLVTYMATDMESMVALHTKQTKQGVGLGIGMGEPDTIHVRSYINMEELVKENDTVTPENLKNSKDDMMWNVITGLFSIKFFSKL